MHKGQAAHVIVSIAGCATIALMYVFSSRPELILGIDIVLGVIMLAVIRERRYVLGYLIAFVLLPVVLDIPGTHLGLWSFGTPDFLGFPYWLPFFYGNLTISFAYVALTSRGMRASR